MRGRPWLQLDREWARGVLTSEIEAEILGQLGFSIPAVIVLHKHPGARRSGVAQGYCRAKGRHEGLCGPVPTSRWNTGLDFPRHGCSGARGRMRTQRQQHAQFFAAPVGSITSLLPLSITLVNCLLFLSRTRTPTHPHTANTNDHPNRQNLPLTGKRVPLTTGPASPKQDGHSRRPKRGPPQCRVP
jgi:hypothetical protein